MPLFNPFDRRTYPQLVDAWRQGTFWPSAIQLVDVTTTVEPVVQPPLDNLDAELAQDIQIEGPMPVLDPALVPLGLPVAVVPQRIQYPLVKLGTKVFELRPSGLDFTEPSTLAEILAPGAGPRYEYMGEGEHGIAVQGVFQGEQAYGEVQEIQRQKAKPQTFKYGPLEVPVWIRSLQWRIVRMDWIPYTMTLAIEFPRQEPVPTQTVTSTPDANAAVSGSGMPATGPLQAQGQAATPNPAPPSAADTGTVQYVVKDGDTLMGICQAQGYSDPDAWKVVANMNGMVDANLIIAGSTLTLPADDAEEQRAKGQQALDAGHRPTP